MVTGAEWVYRTTYGQSFGRSAVNMSPGPDPFCIDYIKERNTPKKSFHTLNTPELTTSYQRDNSGDKTALYNRPLPFKYASELEVLVILFRNRSHNRAYPPTPTPPVRNCWLGPSSNNRTSCRSEEENIYNPGNFVCSASSKHC